MNDDIVQPQGERPDGLDPEEIRLHDARSDAEYGTDEQRHFSGMSLRERWNALSTPWKGVVAGVATVQVALQIHALNVLRTSPHHRIRGGRKWPWGIGIVAGELLGSTVFLAWGRKKERL